MKVKLEDVLEAMDFVNDDTQYYYDVKNEKVLMIFDGIVDGEDNSRTYLRNRRFIYRRAYAITRTV